MIDSYLGSGGAAAEGFRGQTEPQRDFESDILTQRRRATERQQMRVNVQSDPQSPHTHTHNIVFDSVR